VCGLVLVPKLAGADSVSVMLDQARLLRLPDRVSTIIIGNPSIADATMQDSQTLVITGRSSGTTNFIVLDSGGEPIAEQLISVEGPSDNNISVYRGPQRFSYNCAPNCQPNVVPGDNPDYFATVTGQNASRTSTAAGNADVEAR
jgi:hypothetical protein